MTDAVILPSDHLKGTVSFTRKVSDGNYGSSDLFVALQFDISADDDGAAIIAKASSVATQAKAIVFEQLGIAHTLDESGIVVEQVQRAFPGTVVTGGDSTPSASTSNGSGPPFDSKTTNAAEKKSNKDWATAEFASNPSAFYDNRPKKASGDYSEKSPDVKHKDSGIGLWF